MSMRNASNNEAGLLHGVFVVECGDGVAVAYAGKLLAELGARVVRFETVGRASLRAQKPHLSGDQAETSAAHLYLNACKHSVLHEEGRQGSPLFTSALRRADIVLVGLEPSIAAHRREFDIVQDLCGEKTVVTISPYGLKGPRVAWKAYELNAWSAGGMASITPSNSPNVVGCPLQAGVPLTGFIAGLHAAFVGLALHRRRAQSGGVGAGGRADVSLQAAAASLVDSSPIGRYITEGIIAGRAKAERGGQLAGVWECADGHVLVLGIGDKEWGGFAQLLDHPEWVEDERFRTSTDRAVNGGLLAPIIEEWMRDRKKEEIAESAQKLGCPATPVYAVAELTEAAQLRAREYFVTMNHPRTGPLAYPGAPYKLSTRKWRSRPAQVIDESRESLEREFGDEITSVQGGDRDAGFV